MDIDHVSGVVIDEAFRIHRDLGPGLLESVYESVLAQMLQRRGLSVERQKVIGFQYAGISFKEALRLDLLVEGCVIVELKSVEAISRGHMKQLLTYLRLADARVGLLINFGAATFREGLKRVVNNYGVRELRRADGADPPTPDPEQNR